MRRQSHSVLGAAFRVSPAKPRLLARRRRGDRQDAGELAAHLHVEAAFGVWSQNDRVDQGPDDLLRFDLVDFVAVEERGVELLDLAAVVRGHLGMKQGRWRAGARDAFLEFVDFREELTRDFH
ncbi:hypothetical protein [Rhodoblastus acidophilus]|uniref:hypothetical protein n=1 Tax=Rhodoblastus acidophilus TaxID=1074 RepID=UPI002224A9CB|nr:hypothetical protein [Rhodoblastus acidophilus]